MVPPTRGFYGLLSAVTRLRDLRGAGEEGWRMASSPDFKGGLEVMSDTREG
jgi:hypothetical protein